MANFARSNVLMSTKWLKKRKALVLINFPGIT